MKKVTDLIAKEHLTKLPIHSNYWEYIELIPNAKSSLKQHVSARLNKNISRMINFQTNKNNE